MSQQTSPFLEGKYGWDFGESGWNTGMDENVLKFSFMFDRNVDGIVSSLPPAINGNAYYNTLDNRVYFAVGTTYFSTPVPKWFTIVVRSSGDVYQFNGSSLIQVDSPLQLDSRLDAVEVTVSSLGTAAFQDTEFFATQSELDVASAQANAYTDDSLSSFSSSLASTIGASLVGYSTGTVEGALNQLLPGIPGAVGDGVTDDTLAIQTWIDSNDFIKFSQGSTYLITNNIIVSSPKTIDLNGAVINAQFTTQVPAFNVQSNFVKIGRGTINVVGTLMGGNGASLNCVFSGNQTTGEGFHSLHFHDLTVSTNRNDAGASIGLIGECHNVLIENIKAPDNPNCRNIIGIEWGGPAVLEGTGHPHNILVRNIEIGRLTFPSFGATGFGFAVWISAAFNVRVENVSMVEGYGLIMATRGDNANTYAPARYKELVGRGISVENASVSECFGYGLRVIGSHLSGTLDNIPMSASFKNIKVRGKKIGANNNFSFSAEQSDGVVLDDFEFDGITAAGIVTGINNDNLTIKNGVVRDCELFGGQMSSGARWPLVSNVQFIRNNTLGSVATGAAALVLGDTTKPAIRDCIFSSPGETETQRFSITATTATVSPKLDGNHTHALAAGGTSYVIGATADTVINAIGANNTSDSSLTNHGGAPIFQVATNGDRVFVATAIPVSGSYVVGDRVYFSTPVAAGFIGAVCTAAGSPGTWKNFGAITA